MAITNQDRVGKAMELLRAGLAPFVDREFKSQHQAQAAEAARRYFGDDRTVGRKPVAEWDVAALLKLMWESWNDVFGKSLGRAERSLVQELRDCRNKWAHQESFSSDDADRALDSMGRLLTAVSAPQADEVNKMKLELRRLTFDEQVRSEKCKAGGSLIAAGVKSLPKAKCVVLVGNKISPGNPVTKPDGTVVRTLWGELAWQLGGKKAFGRVKADDEKATNPGDVLRELFKEYGPCLILIDEWVAYARQLHDQSDLPAGGFESQFTFAQALTESAKLAGNCLLVISLPASDTQGSPHTQADDAEVGGIRGREALERLRNVVGRVESSWRPATAEEGFEIVRRRLFEPLAVPSSVRSSAAAQRKRSTSAFSTSCVRSRQP